MGKFNLIPILSARKPVALLRDVVAKSPQQLDEENRKPSFLLQINCRALIDENPSHILLLYRREKLKKSEVLEGLLLLAVSALYGSMGGRKLFQPLLSPHNLSLSISCHCLHPS
jgi:hypothetical protein